MNERCGICHNRANDLLRLPGLGHDDAGCPGRPGINGRMPLLVCPVCVPKLLAAVDKLKADTEKALRARHDRRAGQAAERRAQRVSL